MVDQKHNPELEKEINGLAKLAVATKIRRSFVKEADIWGDIYGAGQRGLEAVQNNVINPANHWVASNLVQPVFNGYTDRVMRSLGYGLLGAGAGAGIGALSQLTKKPKRRRTLSAMMAGGMLGGTLGGGGSLLADYLNESRPISRSTIDANLDNELTQARDMVSTVGRQTTPQQSEYAERHGLTDSAVEGLGMSAHAWGPAAAGREFVEAARRENRSFRFPNDWEAIVRRHGGDDAFVNQLYQIQPTGQQALQPFGLGGTGTSTTTAPLAALGGAAAAGAASMDPAIDTNLASMPGWLQGQVGPIDLRWAGDDPQRRAILREHITRNPELHRYQSEGGGSPGEWSDSMLRRYWDQLRDLAGNEGGYYSFDQGDEALDDAVTRYWQAQAGELAQGDNVSLRDRTRNQLWRYFAGSPDGGVAARNNVFQNPGPGAVSQAVRETPVLGAIPGALAAPLAPSRGNMYDPGAQRSVRSVLRDYLPGWAGGRTAPDAFHIDPESETYRSEYARLAPTGFMPLELLEAGRMGPIGREMLIRRALSQQATGTPRTRQLGAGDSHVPWTEEALREELPDMIRQTYENFAGATGAPEGFAQPEFEDSMDPTGITGGNMIGEGMLVYAGADLGITTFRRLGEAFRNWGSGLPNRTGFEWMLNQGPETVNRLTGMNLTPEQVGLIRNVLRDHVPQNVGGWRDFVRNPMEAVGRYMETATQGGPTNVVSRQALRDLATLGRAQAQLSTETGPAQGRVGLSRSDISNLRNRPGGENLRLFEELPWARRGFQPQSIYDQLRTAARGNQSGSQRLAINLAEGLPLQQGENPFRRAVAEANAPSPSGRMMDPARGEATAAGIQNFQSRSLNTARQVLAQMGAGGGGNLNIQNAQIDDARLWELLRHEIIRDPATGRLLTRAADGRLVAAHEIPITTLQPARQGRQPGGVAGLNQQGSNILPEQILELQNNTWRRLTEVNAELSPTEMREILGRMNRATARPTQAMINTGIQEALSNPELLRRLPVGQDTLNYMRNHQQQTVTAVNQVAAMDADAAARAAQGRAPRTQPSHVMLGDNRIISTDTIRLLARAGWLRSNVIGSGGPWQRFKQYWASPGFGQRSQMYQWEPPRAGEGIRGRARRTATNLLGTSGNSIRGIRRVAPLIGIAILLDMFGRGGRARTMDEIVEIYNRR